MRLKQTGFFLCRRQRKIPFFLYLAFSDYLHMDSSKVKIFFRPTFRNIILNIIYIIHTFHYN